MKTVHFNETEGDGFEKQTDGTSALQGVIVDIRGPFKDGFREVDIRKEDGTVGTAALSPEQWNILNKEQS